MPVTSSDFGSMLVPGEALLVVEVSPAGYSVYAGNEAEKAAQIKIIQITSIGPAGRILVSGDMSQVEGARQAVMNAIASISGRQGM